MSCAIESFAGYVVSVAKGVLFVQNVVKIGFRVRFSSKRCILGLSLNFVVAAVVVFVVINYQYYYYYYYDLLRQLAASTN